MRVHTWLKINLIVILLAFLSGEVAYAKTYLVSVGVTDYTHHYGRPSNLRYTVKDAKDMGSLYQNKKDAEVYVLTNSQATVKNVKSMMNKVFSKANRNDEVILFFSGHGFPGGFCLSDNNLLYNDIRKAMAKSKAGRKMIIADACHSGAVRVDASVAARHTDQVKKADVMMFLASRSDEYSKEADQYGNGLFAAWLFSALKGAADVDNDRTITALELFNYVHRGVTKDSKDKQHPVMWGNFKTSMPVMKL